MNYMGVPVILSELMTETKQVKIYRNFKPGQRKGKDKRLRKFCHSVFIFNSPMQEILFVSGRAVMHPELYEEILNKHEKSTNAFYNKLQNNENN